MPLGATCGSTPVCESIRCHFTHVVRSLATKRNDCVPHTLPIQIVWERPNAVHRFCPCPRGGSAAKLYSSVAVVISVRVG
jgi:hypothetical protein